MGGRRGGQSFRCKYNDKSVKCIANCLVRLFAWSVLMRGIRAGELHGVSKVGECLMDVPALAEFASVVHAHVLVSALRRVARQPAVDPIDWWRFRDKSSSKNPATEMVGEKDVAGFAVEANEVVVPCGMAALLNHEPEVDRQTLVARCCSHRGRLSGGRFAEFGSETYGAVFDFRRDLERWYAFDKAMHFGQATKVDAQGVGARAFAESSELGIGYRSLQVSRLKYRLVLIPRKTLGTACRHRVLWGDTRLDLGARRRRVVHGLGGTCLRGRGARSSAEKRGRLPQSSCACTHWGEG